MSAEILNDEQLKLLDIMKTMQKAWGTEKKHERVVPKTVVVHSTDLATRMWGLTEDDRSEKILGMVSKLVASKVGIRQMRLTETVEDNGQKVTTLWFRYSPVGKDKSHKLVEDQKALGRKRRSIFATDNEWNAAVKLIEKLRQAPQDGELLL